METRWRVPLPRHVHVPASHGESKVHQLHATVVIKQHILQLDVAMYNAGGVKVLHSQKNLHKDGPGICFTQPLAGFDVLAQVAATRMFHHDVDTLGTFQRLQHANDVGVVHALHQPAKQNANRTTTGNNNDNKVDQPSAPFTAQSFDRQSAHTQPSAPFTAQPFDRQTHTHAHAHTRAHRISCCVRRQ